MQRIAVFPGSFDPFTIGHESIVRRAVGMFDKIVIAIGKNSSKNNMFSLEQRLKLIQNVFASEPKVEVVSYDGLTVDYCKQISANYLLRGLRNGADFEYERAIAQMNQALNNQVETVFLLTEPQHTHITSTIVREVWRYGGDVSQFLPQGIDLKNI